MKPNVEACKGQRPRPRLCVLTTTYPRDDSDPCPPFVFELCSRLAADFDVTVIAPDAPNARRGLWQGVQVVRYRYAPRRWQTLASGGGILPNLRRAPWQLIWLPGLLLGQAWALWVRRRCFDLIHAHWILPQGLIAVCFGGGTPVVSTSHGADVFALRGRIWEWLRRFVARRAVALSAVGEPIAKLLRQIDGAAPVHCVPMGVDVAQRFTPAHSVSPSQDSLLFVGRLVPKKGLDLLLNAFVLLSRQRPNLTLVVVGDGPERQALQALAATLGLTGTVRFQGAVSNQQLPDYYRAADVVVLPFRVAADGDMEGFGLTLIEALACGCRVVVGAVPAQDEIARGCPGLWRCESMQADQLSATIITALDHSASAVALRAARESLLAAYDWSSVAASYTQWLRRHSTAQVSTQ